MNALTPFTTGDPHARLRVPRRDWPAALGALRRLLRDKDATEEVFAIMLALNGTATRDGYRRLMSTAAGGRIAYQRVELAARLGDRAWLAGFPEGSLARAYLDFTAAGDITPEGLVAVSSQVMRGVEHPVAWFGRRTRDSHDLWHVLTGYGLDSLGEACLVAFSFAQTRALGWAVIALGAAARSRKAPNRQPYGRAILEGYRRGRRASWLAAYDYLDLLGLPLADVRARLGLTPPATYLSIPPADRAMAVPKAA